MVEAIGKKSVALRELKHKCEKKGGTIDIKADYLGLDDDEVYVKCYVPGKGKLEGKITDIEPEAMETIRSELERGEKSAIEIIDEL